MPYTINPQTFQQNFLESITDAYNSICEENDNTPVSITLDTKMITLLQDGEWSLDSNPLNNNFDHYTIDEQYCFYVEGSLTQDEQQTFSITISDSNNSIDICALKYGLASSIVNLTIQEFCDYLVSQIQPVLARYNQLIAPKPELTYQEIELITN